MKRLVLKKPDTTRTRWQRDPVLFAQALNDPETGMPFVLYPEQKRFLREAFKRINGLLQYPLLLLSMIKKSGKTTLNGIIQLYVDVVLGGKYAEGECYANDMEQAQGRVFQQIARIIEATPWLAADAKITQTKIEFLSSGATITAKASDYAGSAGGNQNATSFDELWAYDTERARRLWDETVPVPTKQVSIRIVTTYAGFEDESELLKELFDQGLTGEQIAPDLYAIPGVMLMYWTHECHAPWQTPEWVESMRQQLRPSAFMRMIENQWTSSASPFIPIEWYDRCVDPRLYPIATAAFELPIWVGVDASTKNDTTAIVAVTFDDDHRRVRLVWHRIFKPPIEFAAVEAALLDLRQMFSLRAVWFDPYQMAASAQRLTDKGLPMVEYPQSLGNLTAMGQNLYDLIKGHALWVYSDEELRRAMQNAVAIETPRGWKIAKEKARNKIDIIVALAMAALACVREGQAAGLPLGTIIAAYDQHGEQLAGTGMTGFVSAFDQVEANARELENRPWAWIPPAIDWGDD